jgi:hypothetical protein
MNVCTNHSIQFFSGAFFDPFDPDPSLITIEDVAHSLAQIARYQGHLKRFAGLTYTVAHHSLLVCHLTPDPHKLPSLGHDSPDSSLGDLGSPIKYHPRLSGFLELERELKGVYAKALGWPFPYPPETKRADTVALWAEARVLHHGTDRWTGGPSPEHEEEIQKACDLIPHILALPDVEKTFLNMYKVLTGGDVHA